jgi:hypothetical protein
MKNIIKLEQSIMTFDGTHASVVVQTWDMRTPEQRASDLTEWQRENGLWLPEVQGPQLPTP